jgi:hypothetical protein
MKRYLTCLIVFAALALSPIGSAWAQNVPAEVTDVHDHPLEGVELTVSGNGSTTGPTDTNGKTQIILPQGVGPGDTIVLVLKRAKQPNLMFYTPWEGRATVPNRPGYIPIVLGIRGDKTALNNPEVVKEILSVINTKNDVDRSGAYFPGKAKKTRAHISEQAGFNVEQIHAAIKKLIGSSDDPKIQSMGHVYLKDYATTPKTLEM